MDSDDLMHDPAPADVALGRSTAGNAPDTPGQSDTQMAAATASANANSGPGAWNTKKFRDEYEMAKARLSDQKFNSKDYPDPLLPRTGNPKWYPRGATQETEHVLKELIARVKAGEA